MRRAGLKLAGWMEGVESECENEGLVCKERVEP